MSLKHFLHIYADGQWETPVSEHLDALKKSGLKESLDFFGIGIVGNPGHRSVAKNYIASEGFRFSVVAEENTGWEQVTLDRIECFAEDKVLYTHTKGAAFPNPHSDQWRASMTEGVVYQWRRAVELLNEYDAVGCHWMPFAGGPPRHYSGNFFWAKGEYLNRLRKPVPVGSRWDAEMWMGQGNGLMYDLAVGAPMDGNWLFDANLGQEGVPDGCVRIVVHNNIAGLSKGQVVVRVRDPAIEMCIKEGHFQVLGKRVENAYDYRDKGE